MSTLYTTIGKRVTCPAFKEPVTLSAKYHFTDNPDNPYELYFANATCPVIENSKLPPYDQDEEWKYIHCPTGGCNLLLSFPDIIDYRQRR